MTQEIDLQTIHGQSASPSLQKKDRFLIWLVVYLPSETYEFVSWDGYSQDMEK